MHYVAFSAQIASVNISGTFGGPMNRRTKKLGPRVTVSVTSGDFDALNILASKDDVSVSWVVRRAIDEYLRQHRQPVRAAQSPASEKQPSVSQLT